MEQHAIVRNPSRCHIMTKLFNYIEPIHNSAPRLCILIELKHVFIWTKIRIIANVVGGKVIL